MIHSFDCLPTPAELIIVHRETRIAPSSSLVLNRRNYTDSLNTKTDKVNLQLIFFLPP